MILLLSYGPYKKLMDKSISYFFLVIRFNGFTYYKS